jgi:hypothetical protein
VEPAAERAGFERAGVNHTCSLEVTRLFSIKNVLLEAPGALLRHAAMAVVLRKRKGRSRALIRASRLAESSGASRAEHLETCSLET